jgi:hypothetical protein
VPDVATTDQAKIKVEAMSSSGTVMASDASGSYFSITGTGTAEEEPTEEPTEEEEPTTEEPTTGPPAVDSTSTGSYSPSDATEATPDIDTDKDLEVPPDLTPGCTAGSLIKGESFRAVYYCGKDGRRYVFPNEKTFYTWYDDFSSLVVLTDAQLAAIPLGGNATYKPGVMMVKIMSDPKTYAISRGGLLRWVQTEAVARALYGDTWNQMIHDVSDAFFTNYTVGDPITDADI